MIEAEELLGQAEDIFFELAPENLSHESLSRIQNSPNALFIEIHEEFSGSWEELLYDEVEKEEYVELGVYFDNEGKQERLALFLMNIDIKHTKECHIQW
jgi:uncharacterized protein YciU (UPF0263 family)